MLAGVPTAGRNDPKETPCMQQHIVIMRHGERMDDIEDRWAHNAARPWDPPLSPHGLEQAHSAGMLLKKLELPITKVYCSPFMRCIQTATIACRVLGIADIHICWDVSEALFRLRDAPQGHLCSWLWQGEDSASIASHIPGLEHELQQCCSEAVGAAAACAISTASTSASAPNDLILPIRAETVIRAEPCIKAESSITAKTLHITYHGLHGLLMPQPTPLLDATAAAAEQEAGPLPSATASAPAGPSGGSSSADEKPLAGSQGDGVDSAMTAGLNSATERLGEPESAAMWVDDSQQLSGAGLTLHPEMPASGADICQAGNVPLPACCCPGVTGTAKICLDGQAAAASAGSSSPAGSHSCPSTPESMEQAYERYAQCLHHLADKHPGENILIVTHGDAVGSAVSLFQPGAVAYEVCHTGFVMASRTASCQTFKVPDMDEALEQKSADEEPGAPPYLAADLETASSSSSSSYITADSRVAAAPLSAVETDPGAAAHPEASDSHIAAGLGNAVALLASGALPGPEAEPATESPARHAGGPEIVEAPGVFADSAFSPAKEVQEAPSTSSAAGLDSSEGGRLGSTQTSSGKLNACSLETVGFAEDQEACPTGALETGSSFCADRVKMCDATSQGVAAPHDGAPVEVVTAGQAQSCTQCSAGHDVRCWSRWKLQGPEECARQGVMWMTLEDC